jgi:hypothetical protein
MLLLPIYTLNASAHNLGDEIAPEYNQIAAGEQKGTDASPGPTPPPL